MATETDTNTAAVPVGELFSDGFYVVGPLLGIKEPSSFVRGTETINVKPKVGIGTPFGDVSVAAPEMSDIYAALGAVKKGDRVALPVRLRPPFGAQGPIKVTLRAEDSDEGGWG